MSSVYGVVASVLLLLFSAMATVADPIDPSSSRDYAWLSVKGRDIVSSPRSRGGQRPFIAVGVGYARDVIIRAQDEQVMKFCRAHHLNTVRLPFYNIRFNGDPRKPIVIEDEISNFIDPVVEAAKRNDMYVILDDHEYFHGTIDENKARGQQTSCVWDTPTRDRWIENWVKVAQRYKDNPNVLGYELCNEPNGIAPETVREWYVRCLKAIRQIDNRHIVLVGTCDWSHSRAMEQTWGPVAKTLDAPYNNVVFAFHEYPRDNDPWLVQNYITAFRYKHDVPVLCTEFGATWWAWDETTCREFEAGMMAAFSKEGVGWMVWALGTLEDDPRNPHPPCRNTGESEDDYRARIKGLRPSDSCAYSDIWAPVARIMGSEFPCSPIPAK